MTSNSSCATEQTVKFLTSLNYQMSFFISHASILATFFVSLVAIYLMHTKSIFQSSTKIILYGNVFFANLHQVGYAASSIPLVMNSVFASDDLCSWMKTVEECVPYSTLLYMGASGMVYSQTGLMIERAFATFYGNYTAALSKVTGVTVALTVFVCSLLTYHIIIWDDPLEGTVMSCFIIPEQSRARDQIFFIICVFLTLLNLVSSMWIMHYNKNHEYEARFIIQERFKKQETIDSTHTICVLSMGQFILLFIHSLGMFILKRYVVPWSSRWYGTLVVWVYTLPYSALLFPLILIYRIRATKVTRIQKIQVITATNSRQTQNDHIIQMNKMWN